MNNQITPQQKNKWTVEALEIVGFEEMPTLGIYVKKYNNSITILVDLNYYEKQPCAIFMVDGKRVATDDEYGTLLIINQIIADAGTGKMPTKCNSDEIVNVSKKDDPSPTSVAPKKDTMDIGAPPEPALVDNPPSRGRTMKHIKEVRVYHSKINCLNGDENDDLGPGFAVIINPAPKTEREERVVAQAIKDKLEGLKLEDDCAELKAKYDDETLVVWRQQNI